MKTLFIFFFLPIGLLASEPSHYRGYQAVDQVLFDNVLKPHSPYQDLASFIGSTYSGGPFTGLVGLMGYYTNDINGGEMANGDTNAVSYLVYYLSLNQVSEKIAQDCYRIDDPLLDHEYQPSFLVLLKELCLGSEVLEEHYFQFWTRIHGFLAPEREYQAWMKFHVRTPFESRDDKIHSMALTALMNPYFLIKN